MIYRGSRAQTRRDGFLKCCISRVWLKKKIWLSLFSANFVYKTGTEKVCVSLLHLPKDMDTPGALAEKKHVAVRGRKRKPSHDQLHSERRLTCVRDPSRVVDLENAAYYDKSGVWSMDRFSLMPLLKGVLVPGKEQPAGIEMSDVVSKQTVAEISRTGMLLRTMTEEKAKTIAMKLKITNPGESTLEVQHGMSVQLEAGTVIRYERGEGEDVFTVFEATYTHAVGEAMVGEMIDDLIASLTTSEDSPPPTYAQILRQLHKIKTNFRAALKAQHDMAELHIKKALCAD